MQTNGLEAIARVVCFVSRQLHFNPVKAKFLYRSPRLWMPLRRCQEVLFEWQQFIPDEGNKRFD